MILIFLWSINAAVQNGNPPPTPLLPPYSPFRSFSTPPLLPLSLLLYSTRQSCLILDSMHHYRISFPLLSSPLEPIHCLALSYHLIPLHLFLLHLSTLPHFPAWRQDSLISEISVPGPHMAGTVFLIAVDTYYGDTQKNDPQGQPGNMKTLPQLKSLRTATTLPTSSPSLSAANITSRYTILASYSQQHVLLVSGLPQNHFMVKGGMVFFQFIPQDGYDLRWSHPISSCQPLLS